MYGSTFSSAQRVRKSSVPKALVSGGPTIGVATTNNLDDTALSQTLETALSIARWLRVTSEQGNGPIHLLGFSYGGFLVYAAAGEDTRRPGNLRNIKGIIPVDGTAFKAVPGSTVLAPSPW